MRLLTASVIVALSLSASGCGSDTDRAHARSWRILREKLGGWLEDPALLGHGLDPEGRLVLHYASPWRRCSPGRTVVRGRVAATAPDRTCPRG